MPLLTISDAARVCGVNRSTLQRAVQAGRLSLTPDHRVDTAELLRAGFTLHAAPVPQVPQGRQAVPQAAALQPPTPAAPLPQGAAHAADMPHEAAVMQQRIAALERENALLHEVLEDVRQRSLVDQHTAAWVQQEFAAARQQHAAEMERYDRLLAAPGAAATPPGAARPAPAEERGAMRQRIVALLQEHPEGLSPAQTRRLLGIAKPLANTMTAMARDGLLRRLGTGLYGVL
ncbi:MAG TPA: hypothetical protein VI542_13180 [Candidatus Tectomicrobia bacterium]